MFRGETSLSQEMIFYWSRFFGYPWTASMIWTSGKSSTRIRIPPKLPFKTRPIGHDRGTQHSQWIEQPWIPRQSLSFSLFDTITWHPTMAIGAFNVKSIQTWIQPQSLAERTFSATIIWVIHPSSYIRFDAFISGPAKRSRKRVAHMTNFRKELLNRGRTPESYLYSTRRKFNHLMELLCTD